MVFKTKVFFSFKVKAMEREKLKPACQDRRVLEINDMQMN